VGAPVIARAEQRMVIGRNTGVVALGAALATLALLAIVNFVGAEPGESGGTIEFVVTGAVALGALFLVFGWYVPRAERPAVGGLTASLFGLVSVFAFWSGLPFVLGAAGVYLGARGRETDPRAGIAAIALGVVAIALTVALAAYEQLS
jgi:hypothetical protein